MGTTTKTILFFTISIVALVGIILIYQPTPSDMQRDGSNFGMPENLVAEEAVFDFGQISMVAGDVSHQFKIKNTGAEQIKIEKIYTTCMCTTAKMIMGDKSFGPYGMPGHGFIPKINKVLLPGEEALIETVFDPAAHGPAGVGWTKRGIIIENDAGQALELVFTATVTP